MNWPRISRILADFINGNLRKSAQSAVSFSCFQLVKIYNEFPQILSEYAYKVNLTEESYRQQDRETIFLTETPRPN